MLLTSLSTVFKPRLPARLHVIAALISAHPSKVRTDSCQKLAQVEAAMVLDTRRFSTHPVAVASELSVKEDARSDVPLWHVTPLDQYSQDKEAQARH